MAEVFVQNLRYPDQMIAVMVTIKKIIEESSGCKTVWILEASTKEMDSNGKYIPVARKRVSNQSTVSDDIKDIINEISSQVNWQYAPDTEPPKLVSSWPPDGATDISVETDIFINLSEDIPSSGLDLSSLNIKIKGFDVTDLVTIKGSLSNCSIMINPGTKYQSAINEDFNNGS